MSREDIMQARYTRISLDNAGLGELARGAQAAFRPVWNVRKDYLCGYIIRPLQENAQAGPEEAAVRDLALLAKAAEALAALQARGEQSVVVVPVGFETLNRYPCRGHYLSLLRRLPEEVRAFIVLQLCAIPPHAPRRRVQSVQRDVRALCRALAFSAGIRGAHLDCVSRRDVHACCADLRLPEGDADDLVGLVYRFAGKTQGIDCAAMADGVDTRAALCAAVAAGFSYLAGRAVQGDRQEPGISRRRFCISDALGTGEA